MGLIAVYVHDTSGSPIFGVGVKVTFPDGEEVATGQTDSSGTASFSGLVTGRTYYVRFFKPGVFFDGKLGDQNKSPQSVVAADTPPYTLDVIGRPYIQPSSIDPRLCLISGILVGPTMEPYQGRSLTVYPEDPTNRVVDPELIMLLSSMVTPDKNGVVEFSLPRKSVYVISSQEQQWTIYVPDTASAKLSDLLFPTTTLNLSPNPLSILVSGPVPTPPETLAVEVVRSDGWSGSWKDLGMTLHYDAEILDVDDSDPTQLQVSVISTSASSTEIEFVYTSGGGTQSWIVPVSITVV